MIQEDSPDPKWKEGNTQESLYPDSTSFTSLNVNDLPSKYRFLISAIVPRPVAFVSTVSKDDIPNLAPFSYFGAMGHDPPLLSFSCVFKSTGAKDTLQNLLETKECVVNIISEWFVESANSCSGDYSSNIDEFKVSGLTALPSDIVKPFRVKQSAVQMECKLRETNEIKNSEGKHTTTICLVEILRVHVKPEVFDEERGVIDPTKLKPISRLGGINYASLGNVFKIPRPSVSNK